MGRNTPDSGENLKHERAAANHALELVCLEECSVELQRRLSLLRFCYKLCNFFPQRIQIYWFRDVIPGPTPDGLDGGFRGVLSRDENYFRFRSGLDDTIQNFQPVHPWHHEIQQHNLRTPVEHRFQSGFGIGLGQNFHGEALQSGHDEIKTSLVVVNRNYGDKLLFHVFIHQARSPSSC
jgi:hypothetical protein